MPRRPVCMECKRRPALRPRRRCATCQLRHEPIGEQVKAARQRLAMVPEELRLKRTKTVQAAAPAGTAWCAGCQTFRDDEDFGSKATTCRACASARQHAAMIEKTYGLRADGYDELLERQGGRCAICGARPKSKRLAVDHDHQSGAVRGLLCSRCNHDLMGAAWDSLAMATALWHYLNTPPATGSWPSLERQPRLATDVAPASAPETAQESPGGPALAKPSAAPRGGKAAAKEKPHRCEDDCTREHFFPVGSEPIPGKQGLYRIVASSLPDTTPPF